MAQHKNISAYQVLRTTYARALTQALKKAYGRVILISPDQLETPPDSKLGDLAFPCFTLAKDLKESPALIAKKLAVAIRRPKQFELLAEAGPYVNAFFDPTTLAELALKKASVQKYSKEKVVIEYISPNTNKPLHLGHVRNAVLGDSVARILEASGKKVVKTCLVNDRGIHICKSMIAYLKKNVDAKKPETPLSAKKKGDHFVGGYYVIFEQMLKEDPSIMELTQECLKKWEAGDKPTRALWKQMNAWVLVGMKETYKRLGISFQKTYFEHQIYDKGKEIILQNLKKGIVQQDETGAVIADLSSAHIPDKILLRRDGTALYITQDIFLALLKFKEFRATTSIYVIGSEQDLYLQQLFSILKLFGYTWAKNLYHLSYGMVNLPDGKMKSREGTVVDADDILDELETFATSEITSRDSALTKKEVSRRAKIIALASIKFIMSDISPKSEMIFDPKESISFQGRTGPYILYTYARLKSIVRKNPSTKNSSEQTYSWEAERYLALHLVTYPDVLKKASEEYNPSLIAHYLFDLAQKSNDYYHAVPILKAEPHERACRIALIKRITETIQSGLALLGISTLEEM